MDRQTRHDLKSDKFVQEVGHTVEYIEQHKSQVVKYAGIGLAVVAVVAGAWYYMRQNREQRQADLGKAIAVYNASIGPAGNPGMVSFPTPQEKEKAVEKALNDIVTKYSGSDEGAVALYFLGANAADKGKMADAERFLRQAAKDAGRDYKGLASAALADVLASTGKTAEAEQILRGLVASPSPLVSKDEATLQLARVIAQTKPAEAKKLLEPLRTQTGAVSSAAITLLSELGLN